MKAYIEIGKIYFVRVIPRWETLLRIREKGSLYYHFDYLAGNYPPKAESWDLLYHTVYGEDDIPGVDTLIEVQPSELPLYFHLPYKTEFFDSVLKS